MNEDRLAKGRKRIVVALVMIAFVLAIAGHSSSPPIPRDLAFVLKFSHKGEERTSEVGMDELTYQFFAPVPEIRQVIRTEMANRGWPIQTVRDSLGDGKFYSEDDQYHIGDTWVCFHAKPLGWRTAPGSTCYVSIFDGSPNWLRTKFTPIRRFFKRISPFGPSLPKNADAVITSPLP